MIVVDTNILIYRWFPGPRNTDVETLIRLDPHWAAPLLWRSEMRNVLAGYLRQRRLSLQQAESAMQLAAESLLGGEHVVADEVVLGFVSRSNCSAYDCEFVALAETLDSLLVTEDKMVWKAFPSRCRSLAQVVSRGLAR
jgi:predicted nucleic acid-binding protein